MSKFRMSFRNLFAACLTALTGCATASDDRTIAVFVALCDNASQGIQPVPPKIGDGDVPAANLYWGCSDGMSSLFKRSSKWKLIKTEREGLEPVLERLTFRHQSKPCTLVAHAYRGREIKSSLADYFNAIAKREADLVCYIGHNGLMEFDIEPPVKLKTPGKVDAISLCCASLSYFKAPLKTLDARPILLTQQLMYPGAFVIHDVAEKWLAGGDRKSFRDAAGRAMAKNQKISVRAATGIFAPVEKLD
jgi:hypothetical protein